MERARLFGSSGGGQTSGGHGGGVPEIDPGMASSAIALLACGVVSLAAKREKT